MVIGPQYPLLIVKGDPVIDYKLYGFNSQLILGALRVEEWQKRSLGLCPQLSDSVTLCSQQGQERLSVVYPVYGKLRI